MTTMLFLSQQLVISLPPDRTVLWPPQTRSRMNPTAVLSRTELLRSLRPTSPLFSKISLVLEPPCLLRLVTKLLVLPQTLISSMLPFSLLLKSLTWLIIWSHFMNSWENTNKSLSKMETSTMPALISMISLQRILQLLRNTLITPPRSWSRPHS